MKKLYGIGTGPGAPDLLTIRAAKTIENTNVIFAPHNKGLNMALDTAKDYIEGKKLVLLDFPMGRVEREDYIKAAKIILQEIPQGGSGCFLTIGDPMVYSTFIYIMEELEGFDIDIEVVSGLPSFICAAGESKVPLTKKGETFLLCDELDPSILDRVDSLAVLKTSKNKELILNKMSLNNFTYTYIKRASFKEARVYKNEEDILNDKDYISLILGRKKER